ncbi:MAG TPA: hypothetical protein PKD51_00660 [Saprospiraceae bacterium]|nr:hypothetical protein [Saprospiraceae bacterium]
MSKHSFIIIILILISNITYSQDTITKRWELSFSTELELENQYFASEAIYPDQMSYFLSAAIKPMIDIASTDGKHVFKVELFGRVSVQDPNRTHWDIRQAYYQRKIDSWTITAGIRRIFWGVSESNHLVDIINQSDVVESSDGSEKLGQTMVQISKNGTLGNFEFYYLPFSRRIQLPSKTGRNRFPIVLEKEDIPFKSDLEAWHPGFALRWTKTITDFSLGLSHFYGNSREPLFLGFNPASGLDLSYPVINQSGIDVQFNKNAWILKLESIYRTSTFQDFIAVTSGFEYTFGNVGGKGLDLGLVSEYTYDSRKLLTFSGLDNDLFIGSRIALNDDKSTECLVGGIFDLGKSTKLFRLEASRRMWSSYKLAVKLNVLVNVSDKEILYNFKNDDLLEMKLSKFF